MARQYTNRTKPVDGVSTNGYYYLGNYKSSRDVIVELLALSSPDMEITFYTSDQPELNNGGLPDPSASLATDNVYQLSSYNDYKTGVVTSGLTPLAITAEESRRIEINSNFATHVWLRVANHTAGELHAWVTGSDESDA